MINLDDGSKVAMYRDGNAFTVEHITAAGNVAASLSFDNHDDARFAMREHPANW